MKINVAVIQFCDQPMAVACDRLCIKAWGNNNRPRVQLSADEDDYALLADGELGDAPARPNTIECTDRKPLTPDDFPNKWCVRECERCACTGPGQDGRGMVNLPDFSERVYNIPSHKPVTPSGSPPSPARPA
jgi:hypothetical protein